MIDTFEVIVRLVAAAAAGAVLGWERSAHQKPAGLRTHMLVTLGSAAFVLAGLQFESVAREHGAANNSDLQKVIAGVAGGVGFLGAGTILQARGSVRGLTTAATIWTTAAVGVSCGLGHYVIAVTAVALALVILIVLGFVEQRFLPEDKEEPDA